MDFLFDEQPWELKVNTMKPGDTVDGAALLAMLLGQDEEEVERALETLEQRRIGLDVSTLRPETGTGELALRLRREAELAEKGELLSALEEKDPLGSICGRCRRSRLRETRSCWQWILRAAMKPPEKSW